MYFKNRAEAGRLIAEKLAKYKAKNIVVIALDEGSSIVAAQVAMKLHANMFLYLIKNIYLPGETQAIAGLSSTNTYVSNDYFSAGQLEDLSSEYHNYIDQRRMEAVHDLNVLLGRDGTIDKKFLRRRVVVVISDGLNSGFAMQACAQFLKSVAIQSFIAATPIASVEAVDKMHMMADEICCLSVIPNYMGTNHYYEDNTLPTIDGILKVMRNISLNWEQVEPRQ